MPIIARLWLGAVLSSAVAGDIPQPGAGPPRKLPCEFKEGEAVKAEEALPLERACRYLFTVDPDAPNEYAELDPPRRLGLLRANIPGANAAFQEYLNLIVDSSSMGERRGQDPAALEARLQGVVSRLGRAPFEGYDPAMIEERIQKLKRLQSGQGPAPGDSVSADQTRNLVSGVSAAPDFNRFYHGAAGQKSAAPAVIPAPSTPRAPSAASAVAPKGAADLHIVVPPPEAGPGETAAQRGPPGQGLFSRAKDWARYKIASFHPMQDAQSYVDEKMRISNERERRMAVGGAAVGIVAGGLLATPVSASLCALSGVGAAALPVCVAGGDLVFGTFASPATAPAGARIAVKGYQVYEGVMDFAGGKPGAAP